MELTNALNNDLKRGSKKGFKKLFDYYFKALCSFGHNYLNNKQAIEDLVQESFINYWQKRTSFETINSVKAYLYTLVRNKCLNYLKHQQVLQKHESNLSYELESDQFFQSHIIEEEVFNTLFAEIHKLPESAQKIMLLALNGLKNHEISNELNISVNTVKTQKKIAYSKIKDRLGPYFGAIVLAF